MEKKKNAMKAYRGSVRKSEDRLEDLGVAGKIILKGILKEIWWDVVDWIHLTQDRENWQAVVGTEMNLQILYNVGNFWSAWGIISFSRRAVFHGVMYV